MTTRELIDYLSRGVTIYDLGQPMQNGIPQSRQHPTFQMNITRRHGDVVRVDGASGSTEMVFTSGHVGTHIDALSHVSYNGEMNGGIAVADAMEAGRYIRHGAEEIQPALVQGILLDIPRLLGRERLDGDEEVRPEHLDAALERAGVTPEAGGVILIRTGWSLLFGDSTAFEGAETGTPGIGADGAKWVAERRPFAVGGDTIPFEWTAPAARTHGLPAHKILIVDEGIHIIETMNLEKLAADGVTEFLFVLAPLPLVGATGAPLRPLALTKID